MAPYNDEAYEMHATGKGVSIITNRFPYQDIESDKKVETDPRQRALPIKIHGKNLNSVTRICRLFSFAQLFTFSLTFMGTWKDMNM